MTLSEAQGPASCTRITRRMTAVPTPFPFLQHLSPCVSYLSHVKSATCAVNWEDLTLADMAQAHERHRSLTALIPGRQ